MTIQRRSAGIAIFLVAACVLSRVADLWADDVDLSELFNQVVDGSFGEQIEAASQLANSHDERIPDLAQAQLANEDDFHASLALHFILACHGERESMQQLIESLRDDGHYGAQYLRWVADEEYGWDIELWQMWLDEHPEDEYRDFIEKRWRRQAMLEEWSEFGDLYFRSAFRTRVDENGEVQFQFGKAFTEEDARRLEELPTAKAWELFESGTDKLQVDGDRVAAATLFRQVADEYQDTFYSDQSRELADLLDAMIAEDEAFEQPEDPSTLVVSERIELHIHNLRDVVAYQISQPGHCHVLSSFPFLDEYNAANALRDIGTPAIPALIELLDDRRPIRGVGFFRLHVPERTVLRYQDAAVQILEAIAGRDLYEPPFGSTYLSDESETTRELRITRIKNLLDSTPRD